ncbi:leucine-rich repeat, immunoglobulin-like domain-containing kekkon 5 protein isoform X2 [Nomia melanderi]|uniref:leucine-rich repeat, immunoglobulin-like domain-containing kekkon 5 protein isoform X2 n=1 Tax=Nomia melanderi TaxID=2448451 RepID=UPI001304744E|nr:leucine-rich repeat-containing protein 24-like [Nomia melanderi]XP_031838636.1 leucine-rich repeat-containing protein 24-like [Nomia melanderi]XP_031838637.1 leucine-rich repeat-containing protein 24-like [Nomia melanderi]XP_031838638.1 leucine-rich repeat-containing protein 24-like [Nomia melanderi]XP_031838640.1 leucine-rich repeat-containing protein 24-like [Nomia melanderi]XP_031838641.1 leucine-rich repeat-containing protein 24-like [Nomia melanderi]XP_031838642.1 leucine-rich repeat-
MELRTAKLLLYSTLMVVVCWSQQDWTAQCSPSCKCRWVSGKKTAECINQNLTQIPEGLSPEVQNFDLTGNQITHLMYNSFSRVYLVNLHKLVLRKCDIESIHTDAFNGLKIVIEIDLSANHIKTLYPGTFNETQRLRVLLLNDNKLKVLEKDLFRDLHYLQKVILSNNELERIDEKTFRNLPGLQLVTLNGNNLRTLKVQSFEFLPKLGSLELQNNPWDCNCHLKKFRDWTIERKLYTKPTTCQYPATLADKMWDEISSDEFACRPEIFTIGPSVKTEVGKGNVTFWCRASGIPRPQLFWLYRSRILNNQTRRPNGEKSYILKSSHDWLNLTIPDVTLSDKGDYVCVAKSPGGNTEKNVTLAIAGDAIGGKDNIISLPLALALGVSALVLLIVTVSLCVCYCRRRRTRHDEKSLEAASIEHHGLGEQEKSLITTINPVVKPPRRYEAPSVTSHGTEMTELNRTLLDNDSVFADGIGSGVGGGVIGGVGDDEREERATPELESGTGTLCRGGGGSYRQYPPDLLAFSGGRGASPTSQASTAPDNTRLPSQHATPTTAAFGSPSNQYPAAFKTLPHNRSVTPYGIASSTIAPVMPRHGYVTIPRRPRAPSWSSGPPMSPTDGLEPVYDNLGLRTTADGSSVLSLNKSPEPLSSMRNRPLPGTPSSHYGTIQRSTPNILTSSPLDRAAPEGAAEWPAKLADESTDSNNVLAQQQSGSSNTLGRKVPPRPPPKPKKKSTNGPLYEDEGEDGTEV